MKLTQGVHYKSLSSDLSAEKTRQVLEVLERPEILKVLGRWPVERILIARSSEKTISAEYHSLHRVSRLTRRVSSGYTSARNSGLE
jgi:hypothetical protein